MPYRNTVFLKDGLYHLFNRGNQKSTIFFNARDYQRFLDKTAQYKSKHDIEIICYCLVPNHFHFLVRSKNTTGVQDFMKSLLSSHSHYLSIKHQLQGHLFQGPFRAKLIDAEGYLVHLSRYIHLQPVKDIITSPRYIMRGDQKYLSMELLKILREYPWGSYREYMDPNIKGVCCKNYLMGMFKGVRDYRRFVESKVNKKDVYELDALDSFK